jgi:hypothetical protein
VCVGMSAGKEHHERDCERLVFHLLGDRSTLSCPDGCVSRAMRVENGGCVSEFVAPNAERSLATGECVCGAGSVQHGSGLCRILTSQSSASGSVKRTHRLTRRGTERIAATAEVRTRLSPTGFVRWAMTHEGVWGGEIMSAAYNI